MALTAAAVPSEDPSSTTMISCVENKRSPTFDAASTASVTFASSSCAGSTIEHPGRPDTSNDASGSKSGPSTDNSSGDDRTRTGDPLLAKQVLYQLSYVPAP